MRHGPGLLVPVILVLPFALLWWLVPAFSDLTIGRDYVIYSIQNQLELQLSLAHGTFPLFDPGFAGGSPAAALTLGQLYHPLPHVAALLPGYWDGRALEWNTWLRLLSLALVHLALYAVLVQLRLRPLVACVVSLVTVYNLRMLDLFRYGASLEAYTAHLLLCAALLWYACRPTRRLGPAAIVLSTYLLAVSGHPQMAYYGLAAGGLVWLCAPFVVAELRPDCGITRRRLRFYTTTALCIVAGLLLASAYTLPFVFDFVRQNGSRFVQPYEWSTANSDSYGGLLRNFVRPIYSDVHTAFAGSVLPLLALAAPFVLAWRRSVPGFVWALTGVALFVLLVALGSATPAHRILWTLLPLQSTMRVPGRVTMVLPVVIMLILAWALTDDSQRSRSQSLLALLVAAVAGTGWMLAALLPPSAPFHPAALHTIPPWIDLAWSALGLIALIAFAASAGLRRIRLFAELVCLIAVATQTATIMAFGTWTTARQSSPTMHELEAEKRIQLTYPFSFGWGMYPASVEEHLQHTFFAPQLARLYGSTTSVSSGPEAYELLQHREEDRAVVEIHKTEEPRAELDSILQNGEVTLDSATFNRLVFTTKSDAPALLTLSFPYSDHWRAFVDEHPAQTYRANGNELAVRAPAGRSQVELRYESHAAFAGMALSLLTAVALLCCLAATIPSPGWRRVSFIAALLAPILVGSTLATRIYGGQSLGTHYQWHSTPHAKRNVAFGRTTRMSSIKNPENMHLLHSSRAVDGVIAGDGAATTAVESNPWFQIDLGETRHVSKIVVYEGWRDHHSPVPPYLPLRVGVGDDARQTPVLYVIDQPSPQGAWLLSLSQPVDGRYVTLSSTSKASLSLAEVEVYEGEASNQARRD